MGPRIAIFQQFFNLLQQSKPGEVARMSVDEQTGLLTRLALRDRLADTIATTDDIGIIVFTAGIERHEHIRAMIGYEAMTEIVSGLGQRALAMDEITHVARIAPDTIAGFFVGDSALANDMMSRLHLGFEEHTKVTGGTISVDTTIGFALGGRKSSAEQLLQQAELALGQARANWRRTWLFSQSEYGSPEKKLGIMSELRRGLEAGEFDLHYQPQVQARTGAVKSVEALLRWTHGRPQQFSIGQLIELAEGTGDIRHITRWAIQRAMHDIEALNWEGYDIRVAINLSGQLICEDDFIAEMIELGGDQLHRLQAEITETAMLRNPDRALVNLQKLAELGVEISMDDYGTGYSSLSQIQNLPITELKIDQRFIKNLTATNRDPLIVRSTIDLAHALEMKIVAEGVEDAATYALLKAMGCDILQGYFIARPLPLEELVVFLKDTDGIAAKNDGPLLNFLTQLK
ncbi:MAG: hypothetical protein CME88_11640 [Hirschia sp.]|nr:hypothetical protein [Hirschia sp.]MBF19022.1 hypothetical protein [Hirschia sp.]